MEGKAIAQAFAEGAKTASALAVRGQQMCEDAKPGQMLQAVYDGMNALADQTGRLTTWMTANAERGNEVAMRMAARVETLSQPAERMAEPVVGGEGLEAVIRRGLARVW